MKYIDYDIQNRRHCKRARRGAHGNYKIGDEGKITGISSSGKIELENDRYHHRHDPENLDLVTKKEEIINTYSIY